MIKGGLQREEEEENELGEQGLVGGAWLRIPGPVTGPDLQGRRGAAPTAPLRRGGKEWANGPTTVVKDGGKAPTIKRSGSISVIGGPP